MSTQQASENWLAQAAFYLTCGSVVADLFSIAVCHILLAAAVVALLLSRTPLRFPPIKLPLGLFAVLTVVSLVLSTNPAAGRPQLRKFFVFLVLLVVASTVRNIGDARNLVLAWAGVAALSATRGLVQFYQKLEQSRRLGQHFYEYYVSERITGFMSHWMTFGGQMMIALLLVAALLLFSPAGRRRLWLWAGCATLISAAIVLGFTRSIWIATAAAGLYLVWQWKRWLVVGVPVLLAAGVLVAPGSVRTRVLSMLHPQKNIDSNQHRIVSWRTGWNMIQAHPWFGLGPEHVGLEFERYVPPDVPRPLPTGWYGHLHNIYVHYAAERGIPAALALMWMLGKILFDFLRAAWKLPPGPNDARFLLLGGVAVVIGILVGGIFELNLGDSEVLFMFLTTVGLGYLAIRKQDARVTS